MTAHHSHLPHGPSSDGQPDPGAHVHGASGPGAHDHGASDPGADLSPSDYWEQRYAGSERIWSGSVNATMADVVGELPPGDALDLGCGEGADVLWMAEQGWRAHGLDISATAIERARVEARARGLRAATFTAIDLDGWRPEPESTDLVTASFFQSNVALERTAILRRAASALRRNGHLVLTSHAAPPSWATDHPATMVTSAEELEQLALPPEQWSVEIAEDRARSATAPDGSPGEHLDALVVLRRR